MESSIIGYSLSPQQYRNIALKEKDINIEKNVVAILIEGHCEVSQLEIALKRIINKYSSLRTNIEFDEQYSLPVQSIKEQMSYKFENLKLSNERAVNLKKMIEQEVKHLNNSNFDINTMCIEFSNMKKLLIISINNGLTDINSSVFIEDFAFLSNMNVKKSHFKEEVPFYAVSEWYNDMLANDEYINERNFWENKKYYHYNIKPLFGEEETKLEDTFEQDIYQFEVSKEILNDLEVLSKDINTSPDTILLACWNICVHLLTEQDEVTIGLYANAREDEELKKIVGPLNKYVPLHSSLAGKETFISYLNTLQLDLTSSIEHADFFNFNIFKEQEERTYYSIGFENKAIPNKIEVNGKKFEIVYHEENIEPFNLLLSILNFLNHTEFRIKYNKAQYQEHHIKYLIKIFTNLVQKICESPQRKITTSILLSEELIIEFNSLLRGMNNDLNINILSEMIDEQCMKTPNRICIVEGETEFTFKEVFQKSNQLSNYLIKEENLKKGEIIGICMERCSEMVISMLAVMKAGATYVLLDPSFPDERLEYISNNAQVKTVLIKDNKNKRLVSLFENSVSLECTQLEIVGQSLQKPTITFDKKTVAYIIYTSGSTGKPKGVKISHKAICNHMTWMNKQFPLGCDDSVLQKTPVSFDASVWEFFAPLTTGARLILAEPEKHADPDYLLETIIKDRITILQVVPTMLQALVEKKLISEVPLKRVFCGGEKLGKSLQKAFYSKCDAQLINLYGPAEACIDTTFHICDKENINEKIGKAITNTNLYILNESMQLVPPGVKGELYIGGKGLANGYMDDKLTKKSFLPNPFSTYNFSHNNKNKGCINCNKPEFVYKTGDLVRYNLSGELEYIGRLDRQVKIRGYRIELGEIEKVINDSKNVRLAAVKVVKENYLLGYVEVNNSSEFEVSELKIEISKKLPEFMIPNSIIVLENIPLLNNGKIDYRNLPDLSAVSDSKEDFVAPNTVIEQLISPIWEEVLKRERISIDDNFFKLGGHSLIATQLISKIRDEFGIDLPLRKIFEATTIRQLSLVVESILLEESQEGEV